MNFDLPTVLPTLLAAVIAVTAIAAYLWRTRWVFKSHEPSEEVHFSKKRKAELKNDPIAISLQARTNMHHNDAIKAKTIYEIKGVGTATAAPALIWLAAVDPWLQSHGWATDLGMTMARAAVALVVFVTLWTTKNPTKHHVKTRMRAEVLRFHTHAYLARVGPYIRDTDVARNIRTDVEDWETPELLSKLRSYEAQCLRQSEGTDPMSPSTPFSNRDADIYLHERVGEQATYFRSAQSRQDGSYSRSALVALGVIGAAAAIMIPKVVRGVELLGTWTTPAFWILGGVAVLVLGLRAVFGWDSKAGLYARQIDTLRSSIERMTSARKRMDSDSSGEAAVEFRQGAAAFELAMVREAADWTLVSDRRFFDLSI